MSRVSRRRNNFRLHSKEVSLHWILKVRFIRASTLQKIGAFHIAVAFEGVRRKAAAVGQGSALELPGIVGAGVPQIAAVVGGYRTGFVAPEGSAVNRSVEN